VKHEDCETSNGKSGRSSRDESNVTHDCKSV